jgi:outer membrane protein assembly factor BamD
MLTRAVGLFSALFAVWLTACGHSARGGGAVEYAVTAAKNYEQGMSRLEDEEWQEAAKYFSFVKARFPYSEYAVMADLRIADAEFGAGAYLEAIDSYRQFMKFHPTHEQVTNGYAAFKVGAAFYKMLPDDWFLVPPAYEKDQSATLDAAREIGNFLRAYPSSPYVEKARPMYQKCAHLLAAHEMYVAKFYWKHDRPMGTVLRLRTLLARYPDAGFDEEALFLLGKAYLKVGRPADARTTWQTLISKYPNHKRARDAQSALAKLGS